MKKYIVRAIIIAIFLCGMLYLGRYTSLHAAGTTIGIDAKSSGSGENTTTLTWQHTSGNNQNTILIVSVESTAGTEAVRIANHATSVTYKNQPLTRAVTGECFANPNTKCGNDIWYLVNPPQGTNDIVVTMQSTGNIVAGAVSYYNVDQTNPLGNSATNSGFSNTPSVSVQASASQLAIDSVAYDDETTVTPQSGQTTLWNLTTPVDRTPGAGSYISGQTGTVSFKWTGVTTGSKDPMEEWSDVAVTLNEATQQTSPSSFSTSENASTACNGSTATIAITFTNTDTKAMNAIVTDTQSGTAQNLGTVNPQQTVTGVIDTKTAAITNGAVVFDITWADGSTGSTNRMVNYTGVSCGGNSGGNGGKNNISGNIFIDADMDNKFTPLVDVLYTASSPIVNVSDAGGNVITVPVINGTYTTGAVLSSGTYTVSYTSPPTLYTISYPKNPASFTVKVGTSCAASGNDASCDSTGNVVKLNFGLSYGEAWLCNSCTSAPSTTNTPVITATNTPGVSPTGSTTGTKQYEYVFPDGNMYVYDMNNNHALVKHVSLPTGAGVRGVVGDAATHRLYISFGSDGDSGGQVLGYDLVADKVVWQKQYSLGIDSMSLTPDGTKIYMPDGELSGSPDWYVINASDGSDTGIRITGGPGPHNTVVSLNGQHVYMGARNMTDQPTYLTVADTATNSNVRNIGPFKEGVRPFTINQSETYAFVTTTGFLGFQVADIQGGNVIYTVDLTQMGFPNNPTGPSAPSHGIALSPDNKTIAMIDWPNDYVHLFDVTGLPASAPRKIADIKFSRSMHHNESPCAYDCAADGWLEYSRDGRFLYVGDVGDVIDTATNTITTNLDSLYNTRKMIEVDWQNGVPSFIPINRASVGYAQ